MNMRQRQMSGSGARQMTNATNAKRMQAESEVEAFISNHLKIRMAIDRYALNKQCISETDIMKEVPVTEDEMASHIAIFDTDEYWMPVLNVRGTPEVFCSLDALEELNTLLRTRK